MPAVNNFYETITVDLRRKTMITAIATQGLGYSQNFVTEYIVLYGTDGSDWSSYKSKFGIDQVGINYTEISLLCGLPWFLFILHRFIP